MNTTSSDVKHKAEYYYAYAIRTIQSGFAMDFIVTANSIYQAEKIMHEVFQLGYEHELRRSDTYPDTFLVEALFVVPLGRMDQPSVGPIVICLGNGMLTDAVFDYRRLDLKPSAP
jgi:hypothetical protein